MSQKSTGPTAPRNSPWVKIYLDYEDSKYPLGDDFNNTFRRTGSQDCFTALLLPLIQRLESIATDGPPADEKLYCALRDLRKWMQRKVEDNRNV